MHHLFEVLFVHLAVANDNPGFGDEILYLFLHILDRADTVVEEKDLPAARELSADGISNQALVVGNDRGLHGEAIGWRSVDGGHVARAH